MSAHRVEALVPTSIIDPRTDEPRFGVYRGAFTHFDLGGRSLRERVMQEKRWVYVTFVKEPYLIAVAIMDLGYVQNAFAFVHESGKGLVVDMPSQLGMPLVSAVRCDGVHRIHAHVRGLSGTFSASERRGADVLEVSVTTRGFSLRAQVNLAQPKNTPLSVVARIPGGVVDATEKRALLPVQGVAMVHGERVDLDGALAGFDITWGLLARQTAWNWAFFMGETQDGTPLGMNLTQGFVGEPECVFFVGDELHALGEGRFGFDRKNPLTPWRITTTREDCDLVFQPSALHRESLRVGPIESHFVQPVGTFSGSVRIGGVMHSLARAVGVVEDQRVRW